MGHFVIITCEPPRRDFACSEEKVRFCTNQDEILHIQRKRADSAQTGEEILHIEKKKSDSAQT